MIRTRVENNGQDPNLERRVSVGGGMAMKKERILKSLNSGEHSFQHNKLQEMLSSDTIEEEKGSTKEIEINILNASDSVRLLDKVIHPVGIPPRSAPDDQAHQV